MSAYAKNLHHIRRLIRLGRFAGATLTTLAIMGMLWLGFALADLGAAFESATRVNITTALITISALFALIALVQALRVSRASAAMRADQALADHRAPSLSALSLESTPAPTTPLGEMLRQRAIDEAAKQLRDIRAKRVLPWRRIGGAALALAIPLIGIAIFYFTAPAAFRVIRERLRHPSSDLAPYSPLAFRLDPASPSTVYAGELLVAADISGGELKHPVECLIRQTRSGKIARLPAFRESATRFSRKLEGLTEPLEIAFACGKARSAWHSIELLLEPNILSGMVRISPPQYTGLQPTEFALDTNEIAAIEGSTVELELSSNRPLGSATLDFTAAAAPGTEAVIESIAATIPAGHTASFSWLATRSGRIAATVRDVRGTPSARPLELAFRAIPDLPPNVQLNSPPRMMMATPSARILVDGIAEDDHALAKVRFVRTLAGFRDRTQVMAAALHDRSYPFEVALDLADLGLEAGQTIELMMEAVDHNPSLLGQGSSEISRIHIISEEQYAGHIRAKTTIDQFVARFRAVREARDAAIEALEKLKEAVADSDPAKIAEAMENARQANDEAAELMKRIAEDFPAFELEKRLKELAEKQLDGFHQNQRALEKFDPQNPAAKNRIDEMLRRLERERNEAQQLDDDVELAREVAQLLEMAARFRQIYETQKSLTNRFRTIVEELRNGQDQNRRLLPSLGETQEKNRQALEEFKIELSKRATALLETNPELAPLAESALEFHNELVFAEPESLMEAATEKAAAGLASDAFANAELARAILERLLSEPGEFPQAAQGNAPQFQIPRLDVNATLEQLLESLLGQNMPDGNGQGNQPGGQGGGVGGTGPSGNAMPGYSLDLPVAGPQRMQFDPLASQSGGGGEGGSGRPVPLPESAESGSIRPTDTRQGESSGIAPESIPEPYRDAVKRYFTP